MQVPTLGVLPDDYNVRFPAILALSLAMNRLLLITLLATAALLGWGAGPRVGGLLATTIGLWAAVALVSIPVGTAVALALVKTTLRGAKWWLAAFVPLALLPLYLHVAGWQAAVGVGGWLNQPTPGDPGATILTGWMGAVLIHAAAAIPTVVLIVSAALRLVNAAAEEAASLDVHPWRVLWSITLPQIRPALAIAVVWIGVVCITEIAVTDFFGIRTFAEEVYTTAALGAPPSDGSQLAPPLGTRDHWWGLAGVGVPWQLMLVVLLTARSLVVHERQVAHARWRWPLRATGQWLTTLAVASVWCVTVGLPLLSLCVETGRTARFVDGAPALRWSLAHFGQMLWSTVTIHYREIGASLALALAVALTAVAMGLIIAWSVRARQLVGKIALLLTTLLLVVPGPTLGVATIALVNQPLDSPLAFLGTAYAETWLAPWLVQTIRVLPLVCVVLAASFARIPQHVLDAARLDGATWWRMLSRIVVPLQWPALVTSLLLAMVLSLGEVSATVLVLPAGTTTVAVRLFSLLHYGIEGRVAAMSLLMVGVVGMVTVAALRDRSKVP